MGWITQWVFPQGLFTASFMVHAYVGGTAVALGASIVGFFVVMRNSAFVAHTLPQVGFAGAAGALLLNVSPLVGLVVFSLGGALGIGWIGRRGRHDTVTALILVVGLGTGSLFLALNSAYATGAYALLFGQLVGVSANAAWATVLLTVAALVWVGVLYRPLLFASVLRTNAEAQGISGYRLEMAFLLAVGMVSAITVPIVGVLLSFSLMIGPAASARYLAKSPGRAMAMGAGIAVGTMWLSIILAYDIAWPIGFFVASISAAVYVTVRVAFRRRAANPLKSPKPHERSTDVLV